MKKRTIITTLALTMAIGLGATAYAVSGNNVNGNTFCQGLGLGRITAMRGYEIASDKGLTGDELKKAILEERIKAIDAAVSEGTISKEDGEDLKARITANMENCEQGRGQGCGRMIGGQRGCNLVTPSSGTNQ